MQNRENDRVNEDRVNEDQVNEVRTDEHRINEERVTENLEETVRPHDSADYEVVATIGPATNMEYHWRRLLESGATGFRVNTSHLSVDELLRTLERLDRFFADTPGSSVEKAFLVLDLQGSKWRLGDFQERTLHQDEHLRFIRGDRPTAAGTLPVPHRDFFAAAADCPGEIRLNDARVHLEIVFVSEEEVTAVVRTGGSVSSRKGITLRGSTFRAEKLGKKDGRIVDATAGHNRVRYAFSYVRDSTEMSSFRKIVGENVPVIGKIERATALMDAPAISRMVDELWLCRGDLGAELGLEQMARGAHRFAAGIPGLSAPCLLAGQVLEHMTGTPQPTRSEICHMHDALVAGYAGFVLSDETAVGRYPAESCRAAAMFRKHYS